MLANPVGAKEIEMTDNNQHQNKGLRYSLARESLGEMSIQTVRDISTTTGVSETARQAARDELADRDA